MIKINLALRKQASSVATDSKSGAGAGAFSGIKGLFERFKPGAGGPPPAPSGAQGSGREALAALPIRRLIVALALCAGGYFYVEDIKEEELKVWTERLSVVQKEQEKHKAELARTREYAAIKKNIDADEALLRNKIGVIQTLLKGRQSPHEILLTLATTIPKDVWLKMVRIDRQEVSLQGFAMGFNQVSGFMRSLNESAYFTDVRLQNSQTQKDDGRELASFELAARRRGGEQK